MQKKLPISDTSTKLTKRPSGAFSLLKPGKLYLADGKVFEGMIPEWQSAAYIGEVVFNTGMTGYVESLTDPSYAGQILVFTYPLIGNYGVEVASGESEKIQVSGVVVSEATKMWSHAQADRSLLEWLKSQNIPILTNVDTRALTKHLRAKGTMQGAISTAPVDTNKLTITANPTSVSEPVN